MNDAHITSIKQNIMMTNDIKEEEEEEGGGGEEEEEEEEYEPSFYRNHLRTL